MESGCKPSDNAGKSGKKRDYTDYELSSKGAEECRRIGVSNTRVDMDGSRFEQLKLLEAEKCTLEKTLQEERQLFVEMSLEQVRQNAAQIHFLQQQWMTLLKARKVATVSSCQQAQDPCHGSSVSKLERAVDGLQEELKQRSDERDKWKARCELIEQEAQGAQLHVKRPAGKAQKLKAVESASHSKAQSPEEDSFEKICSDLLEQQDLDLTCHESAESSQQGEFRQQNHEGNEKHRKFKRILTSQLAEFRQQIRMRDDDVQALRSILSWQRDVIQRQIRKLSVDTVNLRNTLDSNRLKYGQRLLDRDDEFQKLKSIVDALNAGDKKTKMTECVVCMDEFGAEPDRQRAYWKDCNHANVCYKCTQALWKSRKRKCPSCNTLASSKPSRLPPIIYL